MSDSKNYSSSLNENSDHSDIPNVIESVELRSILLLQFQPQFQAIIMISIYLSYICSLIDISMVFSTNETIPDDYDSTSLSFMYAFDVIYLVDILSMFAYRKVNWVEMAHVYHRRSTFLLILDIIAIIPTDIIYYSISIPKMKIIYLLRMRYALRIFRLILMIRNLKNTVGYNNVLLQLLELLNYVGLILFTSSCVMYIYICIEKGCVYRDTDTFLKALYITTTKLSTKGYRTYVDLSTILIESLFIATKYISFLYIYTFTIGYFIIKKVERIKWKYVYAKIQKLIDITITCKNREDSVLLSTSKYYFRLLWKYRKGVIFNKIKLEFLPEIMIKEINLDIFWNALKHSHLFRDQSVDFARFVASLMEQKFMIRGEVLFKRNCLKSSMVYVVNGVIQVLSEQDGETPILSFSGGTCIGESTLLMDYPSTCTVVCQSYCELYILHRKNFREIFVKYPSEGRKMVRNILARYVKAKRYQKVIEHIWDGTNEEREMLTIQWLKTTLLNLIEIKTDTTETSNRHLIILRKNAENEINKLVFCVDYLDLLAITEQFELVIDSVFLKKQCPCILRPNSLVLELWNSLIEITAFIFILIYPMYAAFQPEFSTWYYIFSYVVTILWWLDVCINLSTAVSTKDWMMTEHVEILSYRMKEISFYADIWASFPLELFVLIMLDELDSQIFVLLQVLRLLKVYKINSLLDKDIFKIDVTAQALLKLLVYMLITIYYIATILYLIICFQSVCNSNNPFYEFLQKISLDDNIFKSFPAFMYMAVRLIINAGIGMYKEDQIDSAFIFFTILTLTATFFYLYFLVNAASIETLYLFDQLSLLEYIQEIIFLMNNFKVDPRLYEQAIDHIQIQIQYNNAVDISYNYKIFKRYFHPDLSRQLHYTMFRRTISSTPLFYQLSDTAIAEITSQFERKLVGPGVSITYFGELCKEVHIIKRGHCKIITPNKAKTTKIVGEGYCISAVEMCFEVPIMNYVITVTHCELLSASSAKIMKTLQSYPNISSELQRTVTNLEKYVVLKFPEQNIKENYTKPIYQTETKSFQTIKHRPSNMEENVYQSTVFEKFWFIRFLLMKHTITSYGHFVCYWEISRCTFAFLTAIIVPLPFIHYKFINYTLLFLDVTAWIDIYIKHHVCFYNKKGIEITHPVKTTIHYWTTSFFIDFLAVFPFDAVIPKLFSFENEIRIKTLLKSPRLLQIYRIVLGLKYLEKKYISLPEAWSILKFIPLVILVINTLGSIMINISCRFSPAISASKKFTEGIFCLNGTWIAESDFEKPLTPLRTYLYGLLMVTVSLIGPSMDGMSVQTVEECFMLALLSIFGFLCSIYISANIIASHLYQNADLTMYQESMRNLDKFLSHKRLDSKVKQEIVAHFEYVWRYKRSRNLKEVMNIFNYTLQQDILYDVYGKILKESLVLTQATDAFFKSLLLHVKHKIIMNRGIICNVNDVHSTIYISLKGEVEVLGPDYNRLLILPTGSLFGSIDRSPMTRQTLTMVAKGHVELLAIDSAKFHEVLDKYSLLKCEYNRLTRVNVDYLIGKSLLSMEAKQKDLYRTSIKIYFPLVIIYYIYMVLQLYQVTVQETNILFVILLYCFDLIVIVNMVLNCLTSYTDEFGILISDRRSIARRYIKSHIFLVDVLSIVPFEVVSFIFIKSKHFWQFWSYSRCNRFIRLLIIHKYFKTKNQQLNINVLGMHLLSLFIWLSLALQIFTALLIISHYLTPSFDSLFSSQYNWNDASTKHKLQLYISQLSVILHIFTGTSVFNYYPHSASLIIAFICLLITYRFLAITCIARIAATIEIVLFNRQRYELYIDELKTHLEKEQVSSALLNRICLYVRLLWKEKHGMQLPNLLEKAPYYMREAVLNSMHGYHLRKHKLFSLCHVDLIRQIAAQMRPHTFFTGDYITFINDIDECMYFISRGGVDALSEDTMYSETIEKVLLKGDMFGFEQGLSSHCGHEYTYKANRLTVIVILERKRWIHLLDFFPASKEIIFKDLKIQ